MFVDKSHTNDFAIEVTKLALQNPNFELSSESAAKVIDFLKEVNKGVIDLVENK